MLATPIQSWVLGQERSGIIGQNKEGIVSFAGMPDQLSPLLVIPMRALHKGYLAIHLLGLSMGLVLLPPSPSHFRRHKTDPDSKTFANARRQPEKAAIELCSYAVVWWTFYAVSTFLGGKDTDVSRRLVSSHTVILRFTELTPWLEG